MNLIKKRRAKLNTTLAAAAMIAAWPAIAQTTRHVGIISSIDSTNMTLTLTNVNGMPANVVAKVKVTSTTTIKRNSQPAQFSDAVEGLRLVFDGDRDQDSVWTAKVINIVGIPIFISLGDLEKTKAILKADPKAVMATNVDGLTPLAEIANLQNYTATDAGYGLQGTMVENKTGYSEVPPVVELLIAKGADVNAKDKHGGTPLIWAIMREKTGIAKFLIKNGADVNLAVYEGITPLHLAAGHGELDIVKELLTAGAKIDLKNEDGETPLFKAAQFGHSAIVEFLLQKGADVNAKDAKGRTPLKAANTDDADGVEHKSIVSLLQKKGGQE